MKLVAFYFIMAVILIIAATIIGEWRSFILATASAILTIFLARYLDSVKKPDETIGATAVRKLAEQLEKAAKYFGMNRQPIKVSADDPSRTTEDYSLIPDRTVRTDLNARYAPDGSLAWGAFAPQNVPPRTLYPDHPTTGTSDEFSKFDASEVVNQFVDGGELYSPVTPVNDFGITADGKIARKNMRVQRHAKNALTGAARLTRKQFEKFYITELEEAEHREWWGNKQYETDFTSY